MDVTNKNQNAPELSYGGRTGLSYANVWGLHAGAYVGTGFKFHAGATAEVGVKINRFYVGVNCFQSYVDPEDTQLGLTVGYSFSLL